MSQTGTEYLRVKQVDTDAGPFTVTRGMYEFNPDAYVVLDDETATDAGNNPLPSDAVLALQPEPLTYEDWTVAELKAEIDRRNDGRDGESLLSATGNKADLVAAVEADDANPPTPGGDVPGNPGL